MTVIHPPEHSPSASEVTHKIQEMKNNEVNPNNQSHARECAKHTIQNYAIGAGVFNPGRNIGAVASFR